jgi:hypothetical protein
LSVVLLALATFPGVAAVNLLCCNNATYILEIDLQQSCQSSNIGTRYGFAGYGIQETTCFTTIIPPFAPQADESFSTLERVTKVDVFELSPIQGILARQTFDNPTSNVFEYHSIIGTRDAGDYRPNSLQVAITAVTSEGVSVVNLWDITFQRSCILPSLPEGARIGWTNVVRRQ